MPYVGFPPELDPGLRRARRGRRRTRGRAIEVIPEHSMNWRLMHPYAERQAHGRVLVATWLGKLTWPPQTPPDRITAVAPTSGRALVIYYLCDWPESKRPWPSILEPKENP